MIRRFSQALAFLFVCGCREKPVDVQELFTTRSVGLNFLNRGQLPEAEAQFRKLIELAPRDALGYANLGLTYLRAGRYDEAEKQLRRARKLDPMNPEIALIVARLYSLTNRWDEARTTLEEQNRNRPNDARVLYALAELSGRGQPTDSAGSAAYEQRLRDVLAAAPANLAVRVKLLEAFARRGAADSAVRQLEELRRLRPEPPAEAKPDLASAIDLLRAGKVADARGPIARFVDQMELSQPYQAAWSDVKWLEGPIVGRPVLTFEPQSRIKLLGVTPTGRAAERMRFTDITRDAGLPASPADSVSAAGPRLAIASGDFDGDAVDDVFASVWSAERRAFVSRMFHTQAAELLDMTQRVAFPLLDAATVAAAGDVDNDGWFDLFVVGRDERPHLLRNAGDARFQDVTAKSGIATASGVRKALFVDADHDGDLDLVLAGVATKFYRNNADGTFTETSTAVGVSVGNARDAAFADFDDDGRIDLVFATDQGLRFLHNLDARRFEDATARRGLASGGAASALAVGDYDNNGTFDLIAVSPTAAPSLWRNVGDSVFAKDSRSDRALSVVTGLVDAAARFVDVDNDGWLDLLIAGTPKAGTGGRGVFVLHNDAGVFSDRSRMLPASVRGATTIEPVDIDNDGDLDLLLGGATGLTVLKNEDGNVNLAAQIALVGLRTGSGKNNTFGIGSRIELRSADIMQTRVVTSRVTSFGLGPHLKADVLRVQWTNGVPETVYFPGTDRDVLELEQLKGSCAFLYTWDGTGFRFATDVMWRSALGMPMGLMGGAKRVGATTAFAPAGASQEYLRIPGSALQPRGGDYVLQLTEELWETAYMDHVRLLAVDHPDSVDVFVDERFVPPGPVTLRTYHVSGARPPVTAVDDRGNDVRPALLRHDRVYVSNLTPLAYQGVVEPHDLVLDLGPQAGARGTTLFLRGWIYPTDASINVALSQQTRIQVALPSLEVRDAAGNWMTAIPSIGFPSGKDKTIAIDLTGKFPTTDHHVRIRTNMQIYWDQAFVATDNPAGSSPSRITMLEPRSADLHFRGYSRTYRDGGRYGPHWFDYDSVTREAPWRPIEGAFTRFGDVLPLLLGSDDKYVIMAPGDEMTVRFDASSATSLPAGWKRDFLLYTDGWIKDSDLNTAFGTSVGPLPFHKIRSYPYAPGDTYPADAEHERYRREFNTRVIRR